MRYCTGMVTRIYRHQQGYPRLAEWMKRKGIDDKRLAERLDGITRESVTRWRTQRRRPKPENVAALAHALGIEEDQLWQLPPPEKRPSIDAILKDASDEIVQKIADLAAFMKKTG